VNEKIIILAAGKGTRMLTEEPKALVKFKNKAFIEHILDTLKTLDERIEPVIVVGYKREMIREFLKTEYTYAIQEEQLGTGHAVKSAQSVIPLDCKTVMVLSADQPMISRKTLERIIKTHEEKKPVITLATLLVPDFNEWRAGMNAFGRIIKNAEGNVEKIVEFKNASLEEKKITEVNLGVYAFDATWLWENINKINNLNKQGEYLLTDMIKVAREEGRMIESVTITNAIEGLQPNSREELEVLEKLV
jgi:bifunctional N-acetylglucosamine-1-phosphate-uridyltransferase/glucosamine-1-phosphate-acetyltransferase GlmU-like protein